MADYDIEARRGLPPRGGFVTTPEIPWDARMRISTRDLYDILRGEVTGRPPSALPVMDPAMDPRGLQPRMGPTQPLPMLGDPFTQAGIPGKDWTPAYGSPQQLQYSMGGPEQPQVPWYWLGSTPSTMGAAPLAGVGSLTSPPMPPLGPALHHTLPMAQLNFMDYERLGQPFPSPARGTPAPEPTLGGTPLHPDQPGARPDDEPAEAWKDFTQEGFRRGEGQYGVTYPYAMVAKHFEGLDPRSVSRAAAIFAMAFTNPVGAARAAQTATGQDIEQQAVKAQTGKEDTARFERMRNELMTIAYKAGLDITDPNMVGRPGDPAWMRSFTELRSKVMPYLQSAATLDQAGYGTFASSINSMVSTLHKANPAELYFLRVPMDQRMEALRRYTGLETTLAQIQSMVQLGELPTFALHNVMRSLRQFEDPQYILSEAGNIFAGGNVPDLREMASGAMPTQAGGVPGLDLVREQFGGGGGAPQFSVGGETGMQPQSSASGSTPTATPVSFTFNSDAELINAASLLSAIKAFESRGGTENPDYPSAEGGPSGFYQFLASTRKDAMERLGMEDPVEGDAKSQTRKAWEFIVKAKPEAADAVRKGDWARALEILRPIWPSLPGGSQMQKGQDVLYDAWFEGDRPRQYHNSVLEALKGA